MNGSAVVVRRKLGCRSLVCVLLLAGCSASLSLGSNPDAGGAGGSAGSGGFAAIDGGDELRARIEAQPSGLALTMVTLSCAGECANVQAVASGGNPDYTFVWSDGVTTAAREICASTSTTLSVAVTDTAIVDGEFPYLAQTVSATVAANVLECVDGGVPALDAGSACADGVACTGIRVVSATYGNNALGAVGSTVVLGNATADLAMHCDGTRVCNYVIWFTTYGGDPAFGIAKDFVATYSCDGAPQARMTTVPGESGLGSTARLSCD